MRVRLHFTPLLDKDNFIVEWQVFKRALKQETKLFMETNKLLKCQPCQQLRFTWKLRTLNCDSHEPTKVLVNNAVVYTRINELHIAKISFN